MTNSNGIYPTIDQIQAASRLALIIASMQEQALYSILANSLSKKDKEGNYI